VYGVFDDLLIKGRLDVSTGDNDSDNPQEAGEQNIESDKKTEETSHWPKKWVKPFLIKQSKLSQGSLETKPNSYCGHIKQDFKL